MGQIVGLNAKCTRANLNALSLVPTPANGEIILVSSNNSMDTNGQGNFDYYIKGNGQDAAIELELKEIEPGLKDTINTVNIIKNNGIAIDVVNGSIYKSKINPPTWSYGNYCILVDIGNYVGKEITIEGNTENNSQYAFLTKKTVGSDYSPVSNFAAGTSVQHMAIGATVTETVPNDAVVLYLIKNSTSTETDTNRLPRSVTVGEDTIDITTATSYKYIITVPTWSYSGTASYRSTILPMPYVGYNLSITASSTGICYYAFLNSNMTGDNNTVVTTFAEKAGIKTLPKNASVVEKVPNGTTYLYFQRTNIASDTDISLLPSDVSIESTLTLDAKNVFIGNKNVKEVIDELNIDVNGVDTLDISTFTKEVIYSSYNVNYIDSREGFLLSPEIKLYAGETVRIMYPYSTSQSGIYAIAQMLGGAIKGLVSFGNSSSVFEYTTSEDIVVRLCGKTTATFSIVRNNSKIDNMENEHFSFNTSYNIKDLIGNARTPSYSVTTGAYIKNNAVNTSSGSLNCYTSPIYIAKGEVIVVLMNYNRNGATIVTLSDIEGTFVKALKYTSLDNGEIQEHRYRATEDCYVIISTTLAHSIFILSSNKIQDYMDAYDTYTKGTSILDFYANRETENMLRQLTWGYNSNLNMGLTQHKPLCLLHFSDIHNNNVGENGPDADGVSNSNRIITFFNKYKKDGSTGFIDDAIHTGDSVYATAGGNFPWTDNEDIAKILNVMGNHDLDGTTDWPYLYNKFFAPYVEGWGVTVPEDAATEGKCYYYKDYTTNNVRLIVLMDWMWLGSNSLTESYHSAQNTWFQSVLADARTQGLTVICAVHVAPEKLDLVEGCTFNSWECVGHADAGSATPNRYADSVDAFIQAGGDFACWIGGHTHFDMVGTLHSYSDQLCILIENASCWSYYDTDHRITGTLSQDCFNVMSIDSTLKRVNVMRIGSNFASAMQHKGAFSYDYKNKKLLNCW